MARFNLENTEVYKQISFCENIPEENKKEAINYLEKIISTSKNINHTNFDEKEKLGGAFFWHSAESIKCGTVDFWNNIDDLLRQ